MKHFLYTREAVIFLLAFLVRLTAFLALWWWFRVTGHMPDIGSEFPTLAGDSADYFVLTENLRHNGIFSSSLEAPFIPESFRLPGYPFFLYLFTFAPFSYITAMIAQMLLAAGSCVLVFKLGKKFLSEKVSFIAALLFSIEPTSVFFSTVVMSDTIFVFALLLGIYLLLNPIKKFKYVVLLMFVAGLFFGYAVLVRAIAQYLAVFLIIAYLLINKNSLRPYSKTVFKIGAFVVGMLLVMAPWALREHRHFNTYTLSSTPYINFTQYNLVYFYAFQNHVSQAEAQKIYSEPIPYPEDSLWFRSLINEPIFKQEMKEGLSGNILPYAGFHLAKTLPFFMNDSLRDINRMTGLFPAPKEPVNFTDLLLKKDFRGIINYFATPHPDIWMIIIGSSAWVLITILSIGATLHTIFARKKNVWFVLFALGVVFYFGVLSSPVIQPRYRMPAAPFMLLLATQGGTLLYFFIRNRTLSRQSDI